MTTKLPAPPARPTDLYNPLPIVAMDDEDANIFALRQARRASGTLGMNKEEERLYASAVFGAIRYFNSRSDEHRDIMRYRAECDLGL